MLSNLLPVQDEAFFDASISREIHDVVLKAVELRDALTREHGIYVWCWQQAGSKVEEDLEKFDIEGESGDDSFPLCLFPGLIRKFKNDKGVIQDVVVSQVMVEMESLRRA